MWRLALDQNFNQDLLNAVERRYREYGKPDLDVVRLLDVGLSEAPDEAVLEWAAQQERIVLTHDVRTMVPLADARVREGGIAHAGTDRDPLDRGVWTGSGGSLHIARRQ